MHQGTGIHTHIEKSIAFIVLDRPDKFNALNLDLVTHFFEIFKELDENPHIHYIVIHSSSAHFSSGGDIKDAYLHYKDNKHFNNETFFKIEYALINKIYSSKKAISLVAGIAYGAGLAVALACRYSIFLEHATGQTPEIKIAFYPDAGLSYFLWKGDRKFKGFALYFALHGSDISAYELEAAGLITGVVEDFDIFAIKKALMEQQPSNHGSLMEVIKPFLYPISLEKAQKLYHKVIPYQTLHLDDISTDLFKTSPLSLWATYTHIAKTKDKTLRDVLSLDLCLSSIFLKTHDFFEGIRVRLIDRMDHPHFGDKLTPEIQEKIYKIYRSQI